MSTSTKYDRMIRRQSDRATVQWKDERRANARAAKRYEVKSNRRARAMFENVAVAATNGRED